VLTNIGGEGVVTTIYNGGTLSPTKKVVLRKKGKPRQNSKKSYTIRMLPIKGEKHYASTD